MPLRPCLDCGTLTPNTRCKPCRDANNNARYARRGTTAQRGLAGQHARTSRHYRDTGATCACQGECGHHEGECGKQGTPNNPITAGHIQARQHGGNSDPSNYQPECLSCNSAKQHRRKPPTAI